MSQSAMKLNGLRIKQLKLRVVLIFCGYASGPVGGSLSLAAFSLNLCTIIYGSLESEL